MLNRRLFMHIVIFFYLSVLLCVSACQSVNTNQTIQSELESVEKSDGIQQVEVQNKQLESANITDSVQSEEMAESQVDKDEHSDKSLSENVDTQESSVANSSNPPSKTSKQGIKDKRNQRKIEEHFKKFSHKLEFNSSTFEGVDYQPTCPTFTGSLRVRVTVNSSGRVESVDILSSNGEGGYKNPYFEKCIIEQIYSHQFPKFKGDNVIVEHTLIFRRFII